jgi:DNA-binding NarL/FixJ family response regulator
VVELADLKAKKLNRLVDSAEGTTKSLSKFRAASSNSVEEASKSRREKVIDLARQGCGAQEIARRTGIRKGEVSVILRLNRSRVTG